MLTNMLGEEDEVLLYSGFFVLYASKHANQTVDMQGMNMHFDEDGWLDTMGTTPFSIDNLFDMHKCDIETCCEKKAIWCGLLHHIHYRYDIHQYRRLRKLLDNVQELLEHKRLGLLRDAVPLRLLADIHNPDAVYARQQLEPAAAGILGRLYKILLPPDKSVLLLRIGDIRCKRAGTARFRDRHTCLFMGEARARSHSPRGAETDNIPRRRFSCDGGFADSRRCHLLLDREFLLRARPCTSLQGLRQVPDKDILARVPLYILLHHTDSLHRVLPRAYYPETRRGNDDIMALTADRRGVLLSCIQNVDVRSFKIQRNRLVIFFSR